MSNFAVNKELIKGLEEEFQKAMIELQSIKIVAGTNYELVIHVEDAPGTEDLGRWHSGKKLPKKAGKYIRQFPSGHTAVYNFDGTEWLTENNYPSCYKDALKWRKLKWRKLKGA